MATNFCPDLDATNALENVSTGDFDVQRLWWWPGPSVAPATGTTDGIPTIQSKKISIPNTSQASGTAEQIEVGAVPDYGTNKYGLLSAGVLTIDLLNNPVKADAILAKMLDDLEGRGILPRPLSTDVIRQGNLNGSPSQVDPLSTYIREISKFRDDVQKEYCWYYSRYLGAVNIFLKELATASQAGGGGATTALPTSTENARILNMRVNTIIALMNAIAKRRYSQNQDYNSTINNLNTQIQTNATTLLDQYKIFNENAPRADFQKRLVEYTAEKNRAQENMLALFFTLNVVAIASLFIIARNM